MGIRTSHDFWLNRQLAKVIDPQRRSFLHQHFSTPDGIQRFYKLMAGKKRNSKTHYRTGLKEFRDGTWPETFRVYGDKEKQTLKRQCVVCVDERLIDFTPWGELFEEFIPVCSNCINQITKSTSMTTPEVPGRTIKQLIEDYQKGSLEPIGKMQLGKALQAEAQQELSAKMNQLQEEMAQIQNQLGNDAPVVKRGRKPNKTRKPRESKGGGKIDKLRAAMKQLGKGTAAELAHEAGIKQPTQPINNLLELKEWKKNGKGRGATFTLA